MKRVGIGWAFATFAVTAVAIVFFTASALAEAVAVTTIAGTTGVRIPVRKFEGKLWIVGNGFSGSIDAGESNLSLIGAIDGDRVRLSGHFTSYFLAVGTGDITDFGVSGEGKIVNGRFDGVLNADNAQAVTGAITLVFPPSVATALAAAAATKAAAPPVAQQPAAAPAPTTPAQPAAPPGASAKPAEPRIEPIDAIYVSLRPTAVREHPDQQSAQIATLGAGQNVQILGKVAGRAWYLVGKGHRPFGFVSASQVVTQADARRLLAPTPTAVAAPPSATAPGAATPAAAAPGHAGPPADADFGRYHALVIGNDAYRHFPSLKTAVADAQAVAKMLQEQYGFEVTVLDNATRADILGALAKMRQQLTPGDNLLVYYAGRSVYDDLSKAGYWLPVDAATDAPASWLSNADVTDMLKAIAARHVLVVADSCYAGTVPRNAGTVVRNADDIHRNLRKRAGTVLTSGGLEPLANPGEASHSQFSQAFLAALRANTGILGGQALSASVRQAVALAALQTPDSTGWRSGVFNEDTVPPPVKVPQIPEYADLRFVDHDGGDFIFVRK